MAARRRPRQRVFRSPIQPGVSWRTALPLVPIAILFAGLVGTWYVQRDRQERLEKQVEQLEHEVQVLQLENAGAVGNGTLLAKMQNDVEQIARDVVRLKTKLGIN